MSRELSANNLAAATVRSDVGVVRPALFGEFDFAGGFVRLWTGVGQITVGGSTFIGLGNLVDVAGITETTRLEARGMSFTLSGVPQPVTAAVLQNGNRGRSCKLWLGFLNVARTALVDTPILRFSGRMDQLQISEQGETGTITVPAESLLAMLTRSRPVRLSNEWQQGRFSGDKGLEYLVETATKTIFFGGAAKAPVPGDGSDGGYREPDNPYIDLP